MDQKSKIEIRRLVSKRNKLYDQLVFNEKYPEVTAALIDAKTEKQRLKLEITSKKRLYPLEQAARPASAANQKRYEEEMTAFARQQAALKEEAEQAAVQLTAEAGEEAAAKFRNEKSAEFAQQLADYAAQMRSKYPTDVENVCSQEAADAYTAAQEEEAQAMTTLLAKCEVEKAAQMAKINAKLDAQNKKLQVSFDEMSKTLHDYYGAISHEVGEDVIMSLRNVKMYFSGIKAVDDLSFDIKEGHIFGLIGPNGAGKSTLFNCITQFYKPTGGEIYYRDRYNDIIDLTHYKTHDIVKTGIVRTFQNLEMVLNVSVLDNLLIGAHTYYHTGLFGQFLHTKRLKDEEKVNRAWAMEILERMNLLQYKDMYPAGLPYGVLKKIELARTLMVKPKLIILDEPAAGLNDAETEELADIIKEIHDDFNCTIFLVEHDMNLVMNVCDTVCAISFGKMLAIGTPEEIQTNPLVQEAYLGVAEEGA